jgi:tetratricopeptide (TPR) repeat protein
VDELDGVPLLVICTARPELLARRSGWGGGKLNALTLSLSPLTDEETARLLGALLERAVLPADLQSRLLERAEGVPLFAEEYVRMVESGIPTADIPDTLQGLVAARIDGLPSAEKGLLQDAAVLGKVFWSDALGALCETRESLDDALRLLERQEFVRRERRSAVEGARQYVFLHAIVRDVAYGQIPRAARSSKHRRAAEWIAALPSEREEDRAEILAHHLESAVSYGQAAGLEVGDLRPLMARALREAGERADALTIVARAARYYRRALDASDGDPDPELVWLHARAKMWSEGVEGGTDTLERAVEELLAAGRSDLAALALTLLERAGWNTGRSDLSLLDRALELVVDLGDAPTRGRVLAAASVRFAISGRAAEALPLAREAVAIARSHGDRDAETEALNNVAVALTNTGDLAGGLETARVCLELALACGSTDMPRPLINLATFEYDMGNLSEAARLHGEGLEFARRQENRSGADWLRAELALDDFELGNWDEAHRRIQEEAAGRRARGVSYLMDSQLLTAGAVIAFGREGVLPDGLLDGLVAEALAVGDMQSVVPVTGQAAGVHAAMGAQAAVEACLDHYREALRVEPGWVGGGSAQVAAALAWATYHREPLPPEMLVGPETPWREAARLVGAGRPAEAAEILAPIGARTIEAEVRLNAARSLVEADPAGASCQLDLAAAFWRDVGATARLREVDAVRVSLRAAAS